MADDRTAIPIPEPLRQHVLYAVFDAGSASHSGVEIMLTPAGIKYALADGAKGSFNLAVWLTQQPQWQGKTRRQQNIADEISAHARFANWPVLGSRANPVNIEYFQNWPASLWYKVRDRLLRR